MPVIVIGADTTAGAAVLDALVGRAGEVRAFVTDPDAAAELRVRGIKVACGDVSDVSHLTGAVLGCFSAVLVPTAARDGRERSFAADPGAVFRGWAEALDGTGVRRVIWLDDGAQPGPGEALGRGVAEVARVDSAGAAPEETAAEVARLDDLAAW
jgi:uncharacterized protein YbjT (DUF2867 family)